MHETASKNFIGNIDSIVTEGDNTKVTGWIVPLDYSISIEKLELKLVNLQTDEAVSPSRLNFKPRKDVYDFYRGKADNYLKSGFELWFPVGWPGVTVLLGEEEIFKIKGKQFADDVPLESVLRRNKIAKPELIVVDNFYDDPDTVREYALEQEFIANESYHKGSRTEKKYIPDWIQGEFERLLNLKIKEFVGATGVFQYCIARDSLVYHFDIQEYAAMIYLTPNAPLETGTRTFRSKITGLRSAATEEDEKQFGLSKKEIDAASFNGSNFYDSTNMELVDSVANVYNRMVIFNGRALHAASGYFGDTKENGRLFHLFFFNCS